MNTVINSIVQQERRQNKLSKEIERLKKLPDIITVHFMASNPTDTPSLRLDEEARTIMEKIRMSEYRDSVKSKTRWATRASDILQALDETNPTIVHFSGHGASTGELVVFNACFSKSQAQNLIQNIKAAIGMSDSIGDEAACVFAAQLYSSIGFGWSLQKIF